MSPTIQTTLRAFALLSAAMEAAGSSTYIAKLCRGKVCADPMLPLMDWDPEKRQCICRQHPCWSHDGLTHACSAPEFPYLRVTYDDKGAITCDCAPRPSFPSIHIAKDLCPTKRCETLEHPVLDWDEESKGCLCRSHPCKDIKGMRHQCQDARHPILVYREDEPEKGSNDPKAVCECHARLDVARREQEL